MQLIINVHLIMIIHYLVQIQILPKNGLSIKQNVYTLKLQEMYLFIYYSKKYCQFTPGNLGECIDIPTNLFTGVCGVPDLFTNPITCR